MIDSLISQIKDLRATAPAATQLFDDLVLYCRDEEGRLSAKLQDIHDKEDAASDIEVGVLRNCSIRLSSAKMMYKRFRVLFLSKPAI